MPAEFGGAPTFGYACLAITCYASRNAPARAPTHLPHEHDTCDPLPDPPDMFNHTYGHTVRATAISCLLVLMLPSLVLRILATVSLTSGNSLARCAALFGVTSDCAPIPNLTALERRSTHHEPHKSWLRCHTTV